MLKYLNNTRKDKLIISAENLHMIKWYVDVSFYVHSDFKPHKQVGMTLGANAVQFTYRKKNINTQNNIKAGLVGSGDASTMLIWTRLFLEAQVYDIYENILYQKNNYNIILEKL